MKGLREYFDSKDPVESKHISLETKTKIFDVINKHPDYGPKLISYELRKDEYGNTRIDADRIYNELVKLRLNTQKLRERYITKGGKKRIKQPGTPLLTLDGQIILDFESSEKQVARKRGAELQNAAERISPPQEKEREEPRHTINLNTDDSASSGVYIHQQAKPFKAMPTQAKPEEQEEIKPAPVKTVPAKKAPPAGQAVTRDELIKQVNPEIDPRAFLEFTKLVQEDIDQIKQAMSGFDASEQPRKDIKRIHMLLKLVLKHPMLKETDHVRQIFEQISAAAETIELNYINLKREVISASLKDLLKYISKEYKFKDYKKLYEIINEIGMINLHLKKSVSPENRQKSQYEKIRNKLADKNIISDASVLEIIEKDKE